MYVHKGAEEFLYRKMTVATYLGGGAVSFRYVYGTHSKPILQGVGGIKLRRDNLSPSWNGCYH